MWQSGTSSRAAAVVGQRAHRHHGGAHAPQRRVGLAGLVDLDVGLVDRLDQRIGVAVHVGAPQRLDGHAGRDLAALVAAHAVGDREHRPVRQQQEAVLVHAADPTDVGQAHTTQLPLEIQAAPTA